MLAAWVSPFSWDVAGPNPWIVQLVEDLKSLCVDPHVDQAIWDLVCKEYFDPLECFNNAECARAIRQVDLRGLRAILQHGFEKVFVHESERCKDSHSFMYNCEVEGCNYVANSYAKLMHHQVASNAPGHQQRNMLNHIVPTNQCIFCSTVLADRITAQHHVVTSFCKGVCKVDRSYKCAVPIEPESFNCPWNNVVVDGDRQQTACDFVGTHLSQLHAHIASHLDWESNTEFTYIPSASSPQTCVGRAGAKAWGPSPATDVVNSGVPLRRCRRARSIPRAAQGKGSQQRSQQGERRVDPQSHGAHCKACGANTFALSNGHGNCPTRDCRTGDSSRQGDDRENQRQSRAQARTAPHAIVGNAIDNHHCESESEDGAGL